MGAPVLVAVTSCEEPRPAVGPGLIYMLLRSQPTIASRRAPFTAHVFASILALALLEAAQEGGTIGERCGLGREDLVALTRLWLPNLAAHVRFSTEPESVMLDDEEEQVVELLARYRRDDNRETRWLCAMIARRAMLPNHLWQDLGLLDRAELGRLLRDYFGGLAVLNTDNMKWKKFFYRTICASEGFTLCSAPSCRECNDFEDCFGDETGLSAMAAARRALMPTA